MRRDMYLATPEVFAFLNWLQDRLDGDGSFTHQYIDRAGRDWSCTSLYDAHVQYEWPFQYVDPETSDQRRGFSLQDSLVVFDDLRRGLDAAVTARNSQRAARYCMAILSWGGVASHNSDTILAMKDRLVPFLLSARSELEVDKYDTSSPPSLRMNAGFSKIYALLCSKVIMYDSRVGAALALLVRRFLEENRQDVVPASLRFYLPPARSNRARNPSTRRYVFATKYDPNSYLNSAMQASWLLYDVLCRGASAFDNYPCDERRLIALQSALFMIGYDIGASEIAGGDTATSSSCHVVPNPASANTTSKCSVKTIPDKLLERICERVRPLPYKIRGIKVDRNLLKATLEILNSTPEKRLPQNCRNDIRSRTPDGLDRRIKEYLDVDTRTANIVSDVLAEAGAVRVIRVRNPKTGRSIKGTELIGEWTW